MGAKCCGGDNSGKQEEVKKPSEQPSASSPPKKSEDTYKKVEAVELPSAPHIEKFEFDVVGPLQPNRSMAFGSKKADGNKSMSFGAGNQTMHTVGDFDAEGDDADQSSFLGPDSNLSFTNFVDTVDDETVRKFMKNVVEMVHSDMPTNMLEQSITMPSINSKSFSEFKKPEYISTDQLRYINAGKTLNDKLMRLTELESTERQRILDTWRMNTMLLVMASQRIVPTLRQRRARPASPGERNAAKKSQVMVIYSRDMDSDEDESSAAETSPQSQQPNGSPQARPSIDAPTKQSAAVPVTDVPAANAHDDTSIEHYEMLALTCKSIPVPGKAKAKVVNQTWDFLSQDTSAQSLNAGDCLFRFMCTDMSSANDETLEVVKTFINVSSFKNEEAENNTPKVDIMDASQAQSYVGILVKAMYMLPGVRLSDITPELVGSLDYQKACQPGQPKINDAETANTFRVTMTIIRFIFSLTIQFKVSEVTDPAVIASFRHIDGMVPAKVLMLERTKRNISKVDATAKVRSMLLYYPVNGGVLVDNQTIVLNTSLPSVVSKIMNSLGSQGASQSAETADLTRKYMVDRFGDSRS